MLWLVAPAALAHTPGLSYARVEADQLVLTFAEAELARGPTPEALLAATSLRQGDVSCIVGAPEVQHVEQDGIEVRVGVACPTGEWTYEAGHLALLDEGHRHYVEAFGEPVGVLRRDDAVVTVAPGGRHAEGSVAAQFLGLGVEHIVTGWDHLAFLFALLLAARSFRDMATVVTGFTVAHSITLSAATLGLVSLPGSVVEPLIALSIVGVGLENLIDPPAKRRLAVTFALGLVHGFGFAGMLAELGLPADAAALALLCFNLGVELGQLAIVAPGLPVVRALRARPLWVARGVPVASVGVALAGLWWFVERVM